MKFRFGLIPRIILAIVLGVTLGGVLPEACQHFFGWDLNIAPFVRFVNTFNGIFEQFLKFMVPVIILGLVTPAIAETGHGAGRMLLITVAIAYLSTIASGFLSYFVSDAIFPHIVQTGATQKFAEAPKFAPYLTLTIPPLLDVMSALVTSFMLGLGIVFSRAKALKIAFIEFRQIVARAIEVSLVPLLPVYIFGVFLDMSATGKSVLVLETFAKIILVFTLLSFFVLVVQYLIAGAVTKRNPFTALWTMMPAYFTALGTSSSAATIPVTVARTNLNGVRPEVTGFVIPLCATVHLAGSTLKIVSCAVALLLAAGHPEQVTFGTFTYFILMVGVVMVAAPGVPGGAVMSALGVLQSILGFNGDQLALMITLYVVTDSIGTACNVTGDGAIAMVINKMRIEKKEKVK